MIQSISQQASQLLRQIIERLNDVERRLRRVETHEVPRGYLRSKTLLVDAKFKNNSALQQYNNITDAMTDATEGCTIKAAPGTYDEDITFSQDGITLEGEGRPYFDGSDLVGGTIILGQINCNGKVGATVKTLGVDIRTNALDDAIIGGSSMGTGNLYQKFIDLILIGKGSSVSGDRGHGILCQSGGRNFVHNCEFHSWYHGVAFRCNKSICTNSDFYSCLSSAVIAKSDTGSGNAWHCQIANCKSIGTSGFDRAGPFKVESVHASFSSRYITISNCVCENTAESAVLITESAGTVADVMVSNVVVVGGGDSATRADFDVNSGSDVHFTNCESASRSNGYGFRVRGTAVRVRAMNCSSDSSGAGRYVEEDTGKFDYLDLGSGLGTDLARFRNLTFDANTEQTQMRLFNLIGGLGSVNNLTTEEVLRVTWTGSPNTTMIAIDMTFVSTSGGHSTIYRRRAIITRPNSTTLEGAIETIGTDLISGVGAQNTLTITLDVATSNQASIKAVATASSVSFSYQATVLSGMVGAWYIENKAA